MNVSLSEFITGTLSKGNVSGGLWQPKKQKFSVGRELAPLTASAVGGKTNAVTVAAEDDVRIKSLDLLDRARGAAQAGGRLKNFRSVEDTGSGAYGSPVDNRPLYEDKTRQVLFSDNKLTVLGKDEDGNFSKILNEFAIIDDARLSFDADGNAVFLSGGAALSNGKLEAENANEILIRKSGVDVTAGEGSTVLNLSGKQGRFSGGSNVTYLGFYQNATITGGKDKTTYAGYFNDSEINGTEGKADFSGFFENASIAGSDKNNKFSGYFSSTEVSGGKGKDIFAGMFVNGSTANGGDGNDSFEGRFMDSQALGGKGDDNFGRLNLNEQRLIYSKTHEGVYKGLEADFIGSAVEGGEGEDNFRGAASGGSIHLGEGADKADGIFTGAEVHGDEGDDRLFALYSQGTTFESGGGKDGITLDTAGNSRVRTGSGENTVSLGGGRNASEDGRNENGILSQATWQTPYEFFNKLKGQAAGELHDNHVRADEGDSLISVNTGHGINVVATGDIAAPEKAQAEPAPALRQDEDAAGNANEAKVEQRRANDRVQPDEDKKYHSVNRYLRQYGPAILNEGSPAATVNAGTGEELRINSAYEELPQKEQGYSGMRRVTMRNNGLGAYRWASSLK